MKLGLFTAAFPTLSLEEVARWASQNDFEMIEIACWPAGNAIRRYAGVTHIDVAELTQARAREIRAMLDGYGLGISALGYYPNPLDPDPDQRKTAIEHLANVVRAAEMLGVPIVGTFVGKDKNRNVPDNLEAFTKTWPAIVKNAGKRGIKIAIENCPMIFSYDEWPGGNNLASTPSIWRKMWEILPDANFGLNLDPSHLILQMIDYERVIHEFGDRIFHVHAKDLHIDREGLYQHGALSQGIGWQVPRLPGLGDMDWGRFFASLTASGYDYVVSVEHEDRAFEKSEDLVKRGFLLARDVLRPYIH